MKTQISWCDVVWNIGRGCSRVSEGCRNCYAERMALRLAGPGKPYHGLVTRKLHVLLDGTQYVDARWTGKVTFDVDRLLLPLRWREPCRVFVNSMSDLFHDGFTFEQIAAVFGVMAACPRHQFLILTKRPARMRAFFRWVRRIEGDVETATCVLSAMAALGPEVKRPLTDKQCDEFGHQTLGRAWPLSNVWLGVSVESPDHLDRIDDLLETPAAIRFVSAEPLLEPLVPELEKYMPGRTTGIDRLIVGCESGPRLRECQTPWIRDIRDMCAGHGVPLFLKQARRDDDAVVTEQRVEPAVHGYRGDLDDDDPNAPKNKPRGVVERPFLNGKQHLAFPA